MKSIATISAELVDAGGRQDERGRKITQAAVRETLLAAYDGSGLTQRAFAQREGIKYATFTAWLQRRRRGAAGNGADRKTVRFEELTWGMEPGVGPLEVVLPGGMVIRGRRLSEVIELVRALRA